MKFTIHIDGTEHQVEAQADGGTAIDGEDFAAKVSGFSDDRRTVQVGEKTYEVRVIDRATEQSAEHEPATFLLEIAGERVPVTVSGIVRAAAGSVPGGGTTERPAAGQHEGGQSVAGQSAAGQPVAGQPAEGGAEAAGTAVEGVRDGIYAPVPGKIVDVLVKVGDVVEQGGLVLILEAMKMENELHATKKATVAAVLVKKGDQAERGQLLVAFA